MQRKLRALVVDDTSTITLLMERMLDPVADVSIAHDGEQGVRIWAQALADDEPFDIIFMDVEMPVMDGITAISTIRRHEQTHGLWQTPVVMSTSVRSKQQVLAAKGFGAAGYLVKPVREPDILRTLRRLGLLAGQVATG